MRNKTQKRTGASTATSSNPKQTDQDYEALQLKVAELEQQLIDSQQALDAKTREVELSRQNVADLHEAIETIDAGFAMFNQNDRLVYANQQYYKTFPKLTELGLIKPDTSFEQIVREGAKRGFVEAATGRVEDYIAERMEKHNNPGDPYEYFQGRGNWIRTEERRTPSGCYVGTRTDITGFKEIEQKLADLLDEQKAHLNAFARHAPVSFFIKDRMGRYEYVNLHFEHLFGVTEAEVIGKTSRDFLAEEDTVAIIDQEEEVWATGVESSRQFDVPTAGGIVRRLEVCKFPVFGTDGTMIALGGINMDVTEIKNANDEMVRARDQAEAANQAKSEFMASMSHELRTPLTSSLGSLGLLNALMSDEFSDDGRDLLDVAIRNNDALLRLVNELLDYEKILSGTLVIETSLHDVCALTSNIVKDLLGYAQTQSVNFVYKEHAVPIYVDVQEHRFQQVMSNLLSNAAKFSKPGSDVFITTKSKNGTVVVSVTDTGPGIPEDFKNQIYDQFTQVDSSSTRKHGGTGLGLTISKALTESMGGTLNFDSEVGVGSTFYISFRESAPSHPPESA